MQIQLSKFILKNYLCFSFVTFSLVLSGCKEAGQNGENLIAVVGDKKITVDEFRFFYELDPNFGIDSSGIGALTDELNNYIDRFIADKKAENDELWEDPVYKKALAWEINQARLRQLYREVVETPIRVSEKEIRDEFIKQSVQVNVRHLFSEDQEQAREWYRALQHGERFEHLAAVAFRDTLLANNGGNLGWLPLNDFDDNLAREISLLEPNQISQPVRSKWGYHIIQLMDRKDQVIITEDDLNQKRLSIERRIRQKKQSELSSRFINSYIGKMNPQPVTETFKQLLYVLVAPNQREKKEYDQNITVTDFLIDKAENVLSPSLNQSLIRYQNGSITLGEYLDGLKNMPQGNRPRFRSARQLSDQIGVWVRDRLLLQKADEYDFLENEKVQAEINDFKAEQSYYYYLNIEFEQVVIPERIDRYFKSTNRTKFAGLHRKLSHFHGLQEWKWWRAERTLHQKLRQNNLPIWINEQKLEPENKTINWQNRIRMFMIRKPS